MKGPLLSLTTLDNRLQMVTFVNNLTSQLIAWRDICRDQMEQLRDAGRALAAVRARRRVLERETVELGDQLMVAQRIGAHRGEQLISVSRELADARNTIVELRKYIERDNIIRAQADLNAPGPRPGLGPHNLPRYQK